MEPFGLFALFAFTGVFVFRCHPLFEKLGEGDSESLQVSHQPYSKISESRRAR